MKTEELLKLGVIRLKESNIEEPILKARILLAYVLNIPKEKLILQYDKEIKQEKEIIYLEKIQALVNNIPLQYITHKQEFMKLDFYVDENVLIPRADTETLVEEVMKLAKDNMEILDLCTGSGAIAVSLAKYTKANVYASDISKKAIYIAEKNSKENNTRVNFILSNMFNNIDKKFDIIVSNPPYIETNTINTLDEAVKKEPVIALDGGADGLEYYRIIAAEAKNYLKPNGYVCLEIGYNQKTSVSEILEKENYKNIKCIKDLNGQDRVIVCNK